MSLKCCALGVSLMVFRISTQLKSQLQMIAPVYSYSWSTNEEYLSGVTWIISMIFPTAGEILLVQIQHLTLVHFINTARLPSDVRSPWCPLQVSDILSRFNALDKQESWQSCFIPCQLLTQLNPRFMTRVNVKTLPTAMACTH